MPLPIPAWGVDWQQFGELLMPGKERTELTCNFDLRDEIMADVRFNDRAGSASTNDSKCSSLEWSGSSYNFGSGLTDSNYFFELSSNEGLLNSLNNILHMDVFTRTMGIVQGISTFSIVQFASPYFSQTLSSSLPSSLASGFQCMSYFWQDSQ